MPDPLKEARGGCNACYTSPISRAMGAQEAAGFMRVVKNLKEIVAVAQDTSIFEPRNFDRAAPAIAAPIRGHAQPHLIHIQLESDPLSRPIILRLVADVAKVSDFDPNFEDRHDVVQIDVRA